MQWHLASSLPVTLRGWDDEYVFFDRLSGDTYQITWLAAELLLRLQQAPADTAQLLAHFLTADPSLPADAVAADVDAALGRFRELGLIAARHA